MTKIIFAFNKFYFDLVRDIKAVATSELKRAIKKAFPVKDMDTRQHYEAFKGQAEITDSTALLIAKDGVVVATVGEVREVLDANLDAYLQLFSLLATIEEDDEALLEATLKAIQAWQMQDTKGFHALCDSILDDDVRAHLDKLSAIAPAASTSDFIQKTQIGSLAREIAADLDLGDMQKPEDILNRGIGDIVGKVSSKLQEKFKNGSVKQDDLMREAMQFMGGGGDMIANMMKMMAQPQPQPQPVQKKTSKK